MSRGIARALGSMIAGCTVWCASAAVAGTPVEPSDLVESMAFLESYRSAGFAQSLEFYELYSDRAVVHLRNQTQDQAVAIAGKSLKQWGRELLSSGRTALDASVFHEATVEQRGQRLIIRAKRYSATRCYWDLAYQVGIEREGSAYRIMDERLTTNPGASCMTEQSLLRGRSIPSVTSQSPTMPAYSSLPALGISTAPEWYPLSSTELSVKAQHLAEEALAIRAAPNVRSAAQPSGAVPVSRVIQLGRGASIKMAKDHAALGSCR